MVAPKLDWFQTDAIRFMGEAEGRVILADAMGGRKTGTTLSYLCGIRPQAALIVAPKAVHGHWVREANRFWPEALPVIGAGTKGVRKRRLTFRAAHIAGSLFYITPYESMKADESEILAVGFDTVVFDEGHRLKGRRTQVALCANAVTRNARQIIIATGTPVLNHAEELWQYLHMLDPKGYKSFWKWADEHFVITMQQYRGARQVVRQIEDFKPGHEQIVREEIAPYLIQREIHELFPDAAWVAEPEHVVIPVDLSPRERKVYNDLVKRGWSSSELDVQAPSKITLSTRLQQLSSDWGTLDDSMEDGAKVVAATELISDLVRNDQVVVFTKFKATADRLMMALWKKGVIINAQPFHGDTSPEAKERLLAAFGSGKLKVIVGTLASLGEGVDGLQGKSATVIMLDRDWVPARNDQAIGRVRRSGQTKRVQVYHLMANDTIDVAVVSACLAKQNMIDYLANRPLRAAIYGQGIEIEEA